MKLEQVEQIQEQARRAQQNIITNLDKPVVVSAGAGSGKTHTLTQRVVYALSPESGEGASAYLSSIDQVLVTTFTNKAAEELKSRIKAELISQGLTEEALKVDNAWISTIHGICSRMLHENAFAFGLDPAFEVVTNEQVEDYLDCAFETVLQSAWVQESPILLSLLDTYGVAARQPHAAKGVCDMARDIINKALSLEQGFDSIVLPEASFNPGEVLRQMIELGAAYERRAFTWGKFNKYDTLYFAQLQPALAQARDYLSNVDNLVFDNSFDSTSFLEVFYQFPKTSATYRSKKGDTQDDAEFFASYRKTYAELSRKVILALGLREAKELARFARKVHEEYQLIKGFSHLDNTDLIRLTVASLKAHPAIAERYRNHFKLIMIDEFQDTDELQVALLNMIARPDASDICTVGDAQQSIYRFRGADVSVFYDFTERMTRQHPNTLTPKLAVNFRSHNDILKFVEFIFSQPEFFGDKFLKLEAGSKINAKEDTIFSDKLRIQVLWVDYRRNQSRVSDARELSAQRIANHFAMLKNEKHVSPGDMAILLGAMTHAETYANALRDVGLESAITGGSVFSRSYEAKIVANLLNVCQNPLDSQSLYTVLMSDIFAFSDAMLLVLATRKDSDCIERRSSARAFFSQSYRHSSELSEYEIQACDHAFNCFQALFKNIQRLTIAQSCKQFFVDTGYFKHLEGLGAEGLACAGNIYKALNFIEEFEKEGIGISGVYNAFCNRINTSTLAPGVLSTTSSQFVRIMTVHASKGLEFPHIAVAEVKSGKPRFSNFIVDAHKGKTYIVLRPRLTEAEKATEKGLREMLAANEEDESAVSGHQSFEHPETFFSDILTMNETNELKEAQRLLYVALTRAEESIFLSCCVEGNAKMNYQNKGLYGYLKSCFDITPTVKQASIDYGGNNPLSLSVCTLTKEEMRARAEQESLEQDELSNQNQNESSSASDVSSQLENEQFGIVAWEEVPKSPLKAVASLPWKAQDRTITSYTSLSSAETPAKQVFSNSLRDNKAQDSNAADSNVLSEQSDNTLLAVSLSANQEEALAFGTLFHRVAETFLLRLAAQGTLPECLSQEAIRAFVEAHMKNGGHSFETTLRIERAFLAWVKSSVFEELLACVRVDAEVPFLVAINREGAIDATASCLEDAFYLEGEIDALGIVSEDEAFFVDYKTGGSCDETSEDLYAKHLFQAQCYAYALLRQGFKQVRGTFVRVDWLGKEIPLGKTTVTYSFSLSDMPLLERTIIQAHAATSLSVAG